MQRLPLPCNVSSLRYSGSDRIGYSWLQVEREWPLTGTAHLRRMMRELRDKYFYADGRGSYFQCYIKVRYHPAFMMLAQLSLFTAR